MTWQVRAEYLRMLKSYFGWPTIVTTALLAVLIYLVIPMLSVRTITVSFWLMAIVPVSIMMWAHRQSMDQRSGSAPIVFKYMQQSGGLPCHLTNVFMNSSNGFFGYAKTHQFTQTYLLVTTLISLLFMFYTASFIQLFRRKFILQTA